MSTAKPNPETTRGGKVPTGGGDGPVRPPAGGSRPATKPRRRCPDSHYETCGWCGVKWHLEHDEIPVPRGFAWQCPDCRPDKPEPAASAERRAAIAVLETAAKHLENARTYTWNSRARKINNWSFAAAELRAYADDILREAGL